MVQIQIPSSKYTRMKLQIIILKILKLQNQDDEDATYSLDDLYAINTPLMFKILTS